MTKNVVIFFDIPKPTNVSNDFRNKHFGIITLRDENCSIMKTCVSEKIPFGIKTFRNKTFRYKNRSGQWPLIGKPLSRIIYKLYNKILIYMHKLSVGLLSKLSCLFCKYIQGVPSGNDRWTKSNIWNRFSQNTRNSFKTVTRGTNKCWSCLCSCKCDFILEKKKKFYNLNHHLHS